MAGIFPFSRPVVFDLADLPGVWRCIGRPGQGCWVNTTPGKMAGQTGEFSKVWKEHHSPSPQQNREGAPSTGRKREKIAWRDS